MGNPHGDTDGQFPRNGTGCLAVSYSLGNASGHPPAARVGSRSPDSGWKLAAGGRNPVARNFVRHVNSLACGAHVCTKQVKGIGQRTPFRRSPQSGCVPAFMLPWGACRKGPRAQLHCKPRPHTAQSAESLSSQSAKVQPRGLALDQPRSTSWCGLPGETRMPRPLLHGRSRSKRRPWRNPVT